MPNVEVIGIVITPADCFGQEALTTTLKILSLKGRLDIPVALSSARPLNPFPYAWRISASAINYTPRLINVEVDQQLVSHLPPDKFINDCVTKVRRPVTVLMTGPCTNIVNALQRYPTLAGRLEEVVWMAGAVKVAGNVSMYHHDGSAEWNCYWDPCAGAALLKYGGTQHPDSTAHCVTSSCA